MKTNSFYNFSSTSFHSILKAKIRKVLFVIKSKQRKITNLNIL